MNKQVTQRQELILKLIIEQHIASAEPVGSKLLVDHTDLAVSGATIRNEMRDLEQAGYLTHPHTSAGRIPTEQGYAYYIEHIMNPAPLRNAIQEKCEEISNTVSEEQQALKEMAKYLAEVANTAIIIAFGETSVYYTGISYLFSQPELKDHARSVNMSLLFDQCEERLPGLYEQLDENDTKIFVGSENPLGSACGTVAGKISKDYLFATVGPMRMNYAKHVGLVQHIQKIFI